MNKNQGNGKKNVNLIMGICIAIFVAFGTCPSICASETDECSESTAEQASKTEQINRFKKNVRPASSRWTDAGWGNDVGKCYIYIVNNNPVAIDASDYYITFRYAYQYGKGVYEEKVTLKGQRIAAKGKTRFNYHYTDDCCPEKVTVHFKLSDAQIYNKYIKK